MNEMFIKDYDYHKFIILFANFKEIVCKMKNKIDNNFDYYLVDLVVKNYKVGNKTCADIRYHLDGDYKRDNQYCIYCEGENRTIFCDEKIDFSNFPEDRDSQNDLLDLLLKDKHSYEIQEKSFVVYDSKKPHKGVTCKKNGTRTFLRLMGTNYIKPKNYTRF